jgi:hypothetical protein
MNADKPDFKAIQTLTLANERNEEPQVLLAFEMLIMVTKIKMQLTQLIVMLLQADNTLLRAKMQLEFY